jgi:hypothetical protein
LFEAEIASLTRLVEEAKNAPNKYLVEGRLKVLKARLKAVMAKEAALAKLEAYPAAEQPSASADWARVILPCAAAGRYEISDDGFVRDARTKRLLTRSMHGGRLCVNLLTRKGGYQYQYIGLLMMRVWRHAPPGVFVRTLNKNPHDFRLSNVVFGYWNMEDLG